MKTLIIEDNFLNYIKDSRFIKIDDLSFSILYDPGIEDTLYFLIDPEFDYNKIIKFIDETDKNLTVVIQSEFSNFHNSFTNVIYNKACIDTGVRVLTPGEKVLNEVKGLL